MNCVFCVVIFLSFIELTLKTQVSNTVNIDLEIDRVDL